MSDGGQTAQNRKLWIILGILAIALLAAVGWFRLRVDSSLEPLLPEKSDVRRTVLFFRDSSLASKASLWLRLTSDAPVSELYDAADKAEKQLDPKLIKRIFHPPQEADAVDQALGLLDRAPELLNEEDLTELEKTLTPEALRKRMREIYVQLTRPEGSFMQTIIRKDPLGVNARILNRLSSLSSGMGFSVELKNGRLMHPDGRQMLLAMETSATATSLASSQALVANLNQIAASAPPGVEIIPMCAQIHTAQNQQLMQRDTHLAATINGIVFLLLFLLVSRDWRVAAVFLLPLISIAITIGLCALAYPNLSMMVIGVSLTMAGSAVDYGIYVYTAVAMGNDTKANMRRIWRPLVISHLTTLGVFLAFVFSTIPAYRQLGWLTGASLVLSLLAAMFLLPRLVRPGGKILLLGSGMPLTRWGKMMVPATYIAAILMVVSIYFAAKTRFDPDLSHLDGISATVRQNEDRFQKTWFRGNTESGLLVVSGSTPEQAAQANDAIYQIASKRFKEGQFASLSSIWPSAATRNANVARWQTFWSSDRVAKLRQDLTAAAEPYGFAADAFDPFFQIVTHPLVNQPPPAILSSIQEQFTAKAGNEYQMLNSFPDTAENVSAMQALIRDHPEAQVVSRRALGQAFADAASSETKLLVTISAVFIAIFLLLLTRSVVKSLIIMLPAFIGLIAMLAVLTMMGLSMNVVTVVAAILVLALASDYGVFSAYAYENHEPLLGQGMASMHLCALTTVVGTGALIFAKHPALLMVGMSLTSGLLAAYATGFFVIPGICKLLENRKALTGIAAASLALLVSLMSGCRSEPFERPPLPTLHNPNPREIRDGFARATPDHFTSDDTVIIQAPFHDDLAVLGVLNVDHKAGTFELYGLNHMGVQFFHVGGDQSKSEVRYAIPPLAEQKEVLLSMARDIRSIYLDLIPASDWKSSIGRTEVVYSSKTTDGTLVYEFGGEPAVLLEKRLDGLWGNKWRVRYFDYRSQDGKLFPHGIVMDNGHYHYRIIIKNRDWSVEQQ